MRIVYHHRTRSTDAQRIHILEIVDAFAKLGHEVEVVSLVPTGEAKDDAKRDAGQAGWQKLVRGIPFLYEVVQLGYNFIGIPLLAKALWKRRADMIYERYSLFNFTGVVVARLFGIPVAIEVNSPLAIEQKRDGHIRAYKFAQWTERVICNLATKVIVVSTPLAEIMTGLGVEPKKLIMMPNGVRRALFKSGSASAELQGSLGLQGKTVVGFVGWFRKWHGLEMLIDAFHDANLASRKVALLLIGDGPAMADLRAAVGRYGLEDAVVFTGPLPHAQVPPYLDLVDIAVQPAANEYCCPMKILEYMALGKALVAPRQANILDILRENEAAFFEPGNSGDMGRALDRLAADRNLRVALGGACGRAVDERSYCWTANAGRVLKALGVSQAEA